MKKSCFISMLLVSVAVHAQREKISGDPHAVEKFRAEAKLNTGYTKLLNQVVALSRSASHKNTNAAAVRALLTQNSSLLKGIYTTAGIEAPQPMSSKKRVHVLKPVIYRKSPAWNKLQIASSINVKTELPPYDKTTRMSDEAGQMNMYPDTSASQFSMGAARMVYESLPPNYIKRKTGQYLQGFKQSFKVPDDPEIIAAEIKFEYAYLYTGWDTYGAILGMDLALEINNELNGPDYNALPIYVAPNYHSPSDTNHRWKLATTLYPADTIDSDFGEFHGESTHESFTIGGYVTPGKTVELNLLMGFRKGTQRGLNGSYHYAEFLLKKITVTYYKSGN